MKRFALFACIALAGCNPRYQMSETAKAAGDAYFACINRQAAALDDGKSDIASIGIAVDAACTTERHALVNEMSVGHGMAFYQRVYSRSENEFWKLATAAVAAHRKDGK